MNSHPSMTPQAPAGLEDLFAGYQRFRAEVWPERRKLFEALARDGQSPRALVIACSDSRVDPAMVFNAAPGELFIVRNVANLVPPYKPDGDYHGTSAAIEFAVCVLEVPRIIVLGHAMCGGVRALLNGFPDGTRDFVQPWMTGIAAEARRRTLACTPVEAEEAQAQCELETVKLSLRNLLTFPFVAERIASGSLTLHGGSFDIRTGLWSRLVDGQFTPIA
ncbi:carbonic anhydrase [Teichococcus vastitatis]|jgi:carbonic anhydrase|uniref:Carbonic anhydrase n=1 Tax=Teichococcus vastitatis TaxID=2307076 RepID=A0ABS9W4I0_9PROT|nr:carbonic anhydrase [Pseudoroseomonas vastitatis]MCI0754191.1 carbonic anhydrase [Pseudoroseomonas vastitatis]